MSGMALGRTLFSRAHEVLRRVGSSSKATNATFAVGITERGLESVGAVKAVTMPQSTSSLVAAGETIAEVHWRGLLDSKADELYHSLFREVDGVTQLRVPFACKVLHLNEKLVENPDGPDILHAEQHPNGGWIVQIEAEEEAVRKAVTSGLLMETKGYQERLAIEETFGALEDASSLQYTTDYCNWRNTHK